MLVMPDASIQAAAPTLHGLWGNYSTGLAREALEPSRSGPSTDIEAAPRR